MREVLRVPGTCVDVEFIVAGMLQNNIYLVSDGAATLAVDPGSHADDIIAALGERSLDAIILTHFHFDHVSAAAELREKTGALVIASALDAPVITGEVGAESAHRRFNPSPVDHVVEDGDIVQIGNMAWKVLLTPGHSPGSMCWFLKPQFGNHAEGAPVLISGDTLFAGTVGRVDFEGGSAEDMAASMKKLAFLPDETVVLPGHGEQTTIGAERVRTIARFGDEPEE